VTDKPYIVVRRTDGRRVADHYRYEAVNAYDGQGLAQLANSYQQRGVTETVVAGHTTMAAAAEETSRRNAVNSLPGITYYAREATP
jgi:hypothetical protein